MSGSSSDLKKSQSSFEEFERLISCPVCYEIIERPLLLSCGHTFCAACIRKLSYDAPIPERRGYTRRAGKVTCPECRKVTVHGVRPMPVNDSLQSITNHLTAVEGMKLVKNCSLCCGSLDSTYFICMQCDGISKMCAVCAIRNHNGHSVKEDFNHTRNLSETAISASDAQETAPTVVNERLRSLRSYQSSSAPVNKKRKTDN